MTRAVLAVLATALVFPAAALAHARISPALAVKDELELFTLAVPTEKENAATTQVELTPPPGFAIDSFVPTPGWRRAVAETGAGESAVITKVTWSGGKVPTGEDATFSFLASPSSAGAYTFDVRQTYSDGSVVDWNGPESSDAPAPTLEVRSSLGGGSGDSTLAIVALVVGAVGIVLGILGLVAGGRRPLA